MPKPGPEGTEKELSNGDQAPPAPCGGEELLRLLLESIRSALWVSTLDQTRLIHVNRGYEQIWSRDAKELLREPTSWLRGIHPDEREQVRAAVQREVEQGSARGAELTYRLLTPEGLVRWVLGRHSVLRDPSGTPACLVSIAEDITERQRAEEELRKSEERFQLISRATNDAVWDWNLTTNEVWWNEGLRALFGHTPDQVGPDVEWWYQSIHSMDRDRVKRDILGVIERGGRFWSDEYRFVKGNGAHAHVFDRGYVIRDEQARPIRMIGAMMDVTQRKQAEEAQRQAHETLERRVLERTADLSRANDALRQEIAERKMAEEALERSRKELADFIDNATVGMHWVGADGRILWANRAELDLLGYSSEEHIGQPMAALFVDPRQAEEMLERLNRHEMLINVEVALRSRDGSIKHVLIDGNVLWEEGRFVHTRCFMRDITERKRAEEAAFLLQNQLAHVVRVNTMGVVASGLAHELNQPLTAICNYARACSNMVRTGSASREELLTALDQVFSQAERAAGVIRYIRAFLDPKAPHRSSMDLNELVREAVRFDELELRRTGVQVSLELSAGLPLVLADRIQIQQVILNLVRNSREAMSGTESDGRQILIETRRPSPREVRVAVHDRGSGVAPEITEHLFKPFHTTKRDGLGMGLAISRSIIEAHNGRLWAADNPGGGASFFFTLPVSSENEDHVEPSDRLPGRR